MATPNPSSPESPSGVLLELSGILSDQAKKLARMALLRASSASRLKWNSQSSLTASSSGQEVDGMSQGIFRQATVYCVRFYPKIFLQELIGSSGP